MILEYNEDEMRFKTISEFKNSLFDGGEIVIEWNDTPYGIFYDGATFYITTQNKTEHYCKNIDELLEKYIGNDKLRDIITKATVLDRAL
ncbi:MAG: hypothetical protein IJC83_03580 [Oscillospiraceae bacterium]|nr:hypothetical protein [Oscillospiraceae bacterium]